MENLLLWRWRRGWLYSSSKWFFGLRHWHLIHFCIFSIYIICAFFQLDLRFGSVNSVINSSVSYAWQINAFEYICAKSWVNQNYVFVSLFKRLSRDDRKKVIIIQQSICFPDFRKLQFLQVFFHSFEVQWFRLNDDFVFLYQKWSSEIQWYDIILWILVTFTWLTWNIVKVHFRQISYQSCLQLLPNFWKWISEYIKRWRIDQLALNILSELLWEIFLRYV